MMAERGKPNHLKTSLTNGMPKLLETRVTPCTLECVALFSSKRTKIDRDVRKEMDTFCTQRVSSFGFCQKHIGGVCPENLKPPLNRDKKKGCRFT